VRANAEYVCGSCEAAHEMDDWHNSDGVQAHVSDREREVGGVYVAAAVSGDYYGGKFAIDGSGRGCRFRRVAACVTVGRAVCHFR
jgi:hypothetical protein